jgi:GTP-binding protein
VGRGLERVLPAVTSAIASHRLRLPTAEVNQIVRDAQERRPHPRTAGKNVRILYAVQADTAPPTIVLFSTGAIEPTYLRYLDRRLRFVHGFEGSPLRLRYRIRSRRKVEV